MMKAVLKNLIDADIPLCLWSAPGTGKTASITAMAREYGAHIEVLIGSTMDPTDLGRPFISGGEVKVSPPPWARRLRAALDAGQNAWLFLDELTCAPPSIQAALLRVINERQVVDIDLSDCRIMAASNPVEQSADGIGLSAATANRMAHLEWTVDIDDWVAGEIGGWGQGVDPRLAGIRGLVSGFLQFRGDALLCPPAADVEELRGWASPRSWSGLVKAIGQFDGQPEIALLSQAGRTISTAMIGDAMTAEFLAWVSDSDLPKPEDLLSGKEPVPTRGDRAMAAMAGARALAVSKNMQDPYFNLSLKLREDLSLVETRRGIRAFKKSKQEISWTPELQRIWEKMKALT
jgi:hypothetical protein